MMKKMVAALGVLLLGVLLTTCQNPVIEAIDTRTLYNIRIYPQPEHGTLTLSHEYATSGTWVTVYINPDPGYRLKADSLLSWNESGGNPSRLGREGLMYQFQCPTNNRVITGTFEPVSGAYKTVSVDKAITHGTVYVDPLWANAGREITVYVLPETGYDIEEGSLKLDDGTPIPEALPYKFTLPNRHVTVSLTFVKRDFDGLVESGRKYLTGGKYDDAASFYEEAYKRIEDNPGHQAIPEILMYSSLAKLAGMLLDDDVRNLLSGQLHFSRAPGTLEDWICDAGTGWTGGDDKIWYMDWIVDAEDDPTDPDNLVTLPKIYSRYAGWLTPFGDFGLAQGSSLNTRQKFLNLMFWGLIASNNRGFNPFVDQVNRYIFGEDFEAAAARAAGFPAGERVLLNAALKNRFGLDEIYGPGDTYIGKTELDYIFGNLRAIKAAFQFLASYNWSMDFRPLFMTEQLNPDWGFDEILDTFFVNVREMRDRNGFINYWKDPSVVTSFLPFNNNFLKVRDASALVNAKTELSKALAMINTSMNYWYGSGGAGSSRFSAGAKANHQWAKDGWAAAKTAVDGGGVFYFPKKLPKSVSGAQWPGQAAADYGIDLTKLFAPGALTLTNYFTTEQNGKAPSLFKIKWYYQPGTFNAVWTDEGTLVTSFIQGDGAEAYPEGEAPWGYYSYEVNTKNLKELFPKGFSGFGDKAWFYKVFPHVVLWPEADTYMDGRKLTAASLYKYYHYDYQY